MKICGRQPLQGDGTAWCVRKERHKGLHLTGDNGSFRSVQPGERVDGTYYRALDPNTSDPVDQRKSSRRLTPQVGKAGALPEQGRRVGRDRRAARIATTLRDLERRIRALPATDRPDDATKAACVALLETASNRVRWYDSPHRTSKPTPQRALDALELASAMTAIVIGKPLRDVVQHHGRGVALLQRVIGAYYVGK